MGQEGEQSFGTVKALVHDRFAHPDGIDPDAAEDVITARISPHENRRALVAGGVAIVVGVAGAAAVLAYKLHKDGESK